MIDFLNLVFNRGNTFVSMHSLKKSRQQKFKIENCKIKYICKYKMNDENIYNLLYHKVINYNTNANLIIGFT